MSWQLSLLGTYREMKESGEWVKKIAICKMWIKNIAKKCWKVISERWKMNDKLRNYHSFSSHSVVIELHVSSCFEIYSLAHANSTDVAAYTFLHDALWHTTTTFSSPFETFQITLLLLPTYKFLLKWLRMIFKKVDLLSR